MGVRDTPTPAERREAFRAIYEAHHAALCAYFARRAPRDEVEDLAAETFAVAWRRLPRRLEPIPQYFGAVPNVPSAPDPSALPWTVSWGDLDHL